jgi:hypothetical protein
MRASRGLILKGSTILDYPAQEKPPDDLQLELEELFVRSFPPDANAENIFWGSRAPHSGQVRWKVSLFNP